MAEEVCTGGQLEKLGDFLKERKGFLLYHGDADGVCSAALLLKFYKGLEYSPRKGPAMGEDIIGAVLSKGPKLLVFLDLPVDQENKALSRLLKELPGLRIIVIDHHIAERNVNSDRVLHINPRFMVKDVYMPASCMVYRLLEALCKDVKPLVWMAAMGVIGDYRWEDCPELIRECREQYPNLIKGEPRESRLSEGADAIAAAATIKGLPGVGEALKVLLGSQGFEDFESSERLWEWKRELDDEIRAVTEDFERNKQVFGELVAYEVKSGINLTSIVSTILGDRFPDRVIAIRKQERGLWKVSLRKQSDGLNLGEIVKSCSKGLGSGGGHEKAAAALVSDWDEFLKRLRKAVRASS